ncbi:MAG: hypothetical protein WD119_00765 [Pirellulaceae bacterium]
MHTVAIILLALFSVAETERPGISLTSPSGDPLPADAALEILPESSVANPDNALAAEQSVETPIAFPAPASPELQSPLESRRDPEAESINLAARLAELVGSARVVRLPGGGLGGRSPEGRIEFGTRFGATPQSEEAVELALRWLANHQRNNGSWSFDLEDRPCNGRCDNPRDNPDRLPTPPTAATGLALLAFLGAGYTHQSGPYTEEVRQGLYYLRERMQPAALGSDLQMGSMYGHGIATLAIIEAASMTGDQELRHQGEQLTKFILAARHPTKGWGYTPGSPGDITLTGWQAMALFGAKRLEIVMPSDIFSSIKAYVDSLSPDEGIHFGYREPAESPTPTAIGLALQLYLGRPPDHPQQRLGLEAMQAAGPQPNNVYHNYYATLALHHARHAKWDQWHVPLRERLIETQSRQGHQTGSWHFPDHYGDVGGRLYTTAMCAMILEVYYRYLPLYADPGEFPL